MELFKTVELERALTACALLDPTVLDLVNVQVTDFSDLLCRRLWTAMGTLQAEGKPFDEVILATQAGVELTDISRVAIASMTAGNAEHYAALVRTRSMERQIIALCANLQTDYRAGKLEGEELFNAAMAGLSRIDLRGERTSLTIRELIHERLKQLDEIAEAKARGEVASTGIPTGIKRLDKFLGGLQRGIVTVAAARPQMGKSAFAMQCADHASELGVGVHVFSLEDPRDAYADRAMSKRSRVPAFDIRAANLKKEQLIPLRKGIAELMVRKHWCYEDVTGITAEQLVRAVRRQRRDNQTELVIVDYLQLLGGEHSKETRHDFLRRSLHILADAAKQDNMAYVVLSQLARRVEQRQDKRPMLADLRESGAIEERAKCVLGFYRGVEYGEPQAGIDFDPEQDDPAPTPLEWQRRLEIAILKYNQGMKATIRCDWDGPTMTIRDDRP